MFDVILVAVDGSEHGQHAARVAGDMARALHAGHVLVVVAYEPVPSYVTGVNLELARASRTDEARLILAQAQEMLGDLPGKVELQMVEGSIAEAILEIAHARRCDLVVMGSRGFGRLEGAVLGSNSQKVVNHAPCPVLIVR